MGGHEIRIEATQSLEHAHGEGDIPPIDMLDVQSDEGRIGRQVFENIQQDSLGYIQ